MPRILILDDDKDLLTVIKSLLYKKGFDVFAYSDWGKAWNAIKTYQPQLILLDVFMNGTDGVDACKKLRSSSFTRNIPIIMLSSYPNIAETSINEFGADDFIAKPFETSEIIRKIQSILKRKSASA
jgi:DNA-binding response OmpR family regulator